MTIGNIHSCESFAAADGPGVRYMIFLSGCPLRCRYCHNPDTWAIPPARQATTDELLSQALRYREYWGKEGGITVSGGEPLLQAAFLCELFEKAKQKGINTCLDTSGACFDKDNQEICRALDLSDTILLDIKHIDEEKHIALTGASNKPTLACAEYLAQKQKNVWIRHVLVPGLTDNEDDLKKLSAYIRTLPNVTKVEVLPYHTLGVDKWKRLGIDYTLTDTPSPTETSLLHAKQHLKL